MRKIHGRRLRPLTALVTGAMIMGLGSCTIGPLDIFGGAQGLLQTVGLAVAAEALQAALILILGPTSINGPLSVPGVTA